MIIGIDLDCTINNMMEKWIHRYNVDWNDNLKYEDVKVWEIDKYIKKESIKTFFSYLREKDFFFRGIDVQPNAKEGIQHLLNNGHTLYIVTAYVSESCYDKVRWLKQNFTCFDETNIIFCNNKGLLKLDVLIDDGLHNFLSFSGIKIIYTQPWNAKYKEANYRINDWNEIMDIKIFNKK
jgi:5'(3')-deoxyribonucleotidase